MKKIKKSEDDFKSVETPEVYYMTNVIEDIKNLNIKNFNYIIFEEDLDNMSKADFNYFLKEELSPIIYKMRDKLDIDIDLIYSSNIGAQQIYVKNVVRFIMNTLPYIYLRGYIDTLEMENYHDILDDLKVNTIDKMILRIQEASKQYSSFNDIMNGLEDNLPNDKKKENFNDMLALLDTSTQAEKRLLHYQEEIIDNSSSEGLFELLKIYLNKDRDNIII